MPDGGFLAGPQADALMGSLLGLTGELLLLSARQRRIEAAIEGGRVDLAAPLGDDERAWIAERADALVAAWLDPFAHDGGAAHAS
ncbi:hypothetical protein [Dactylosporangium sp. CA-092794]|uniref:hypothetical protein n=1 Tax=Dactylosporangium sp. CA-092794 TaxID=3239929 RepID=UPI003D9122F5